MTPPRDAAKSKPKMAAKPRAGVVSGSRDTKRDTLNLRIKREDRALIDRAATLAGKSRTDFLLDAGRRAATDALLDRAFFQVDAATFAAFVERLDASPRPNDRLVRTLQSAAPWDK